MKDPSKNCPYTELQLRILASKITAQELIFDYLDMTWLDLFYDLHDRLEERKDYFEDLK